jgi:hypothetical protein
MSHLAAGLGFVTPLRAFLPFQLLFLVLNLRATGQRCLAECGGGGGCGAAAAAAGSCPAAATEAVGYYAWAKRWIRLLVPPAALLRREPRWRPSPCLGGCYAVHAWLQVGGPLRPPGCTLLEHLHSILHHALRTCACLPPLANRSLAPNPVRPSVSCSKQSGAPVGLVF